jgi:mRNA-degrading endonuclease toxin of MazEF toxin-antitoxin module
VAGEEPRLGEVWWVVVPMPSKSAQRKERPSVVVSSAPPEKTENTVVVVPLSTSTYRLTEFDIPVQAATGLGRSMGVRKDGAIFCSMPETVSIAECTEKMGRVNRKTLAKIHGNLRKLLFGDTG